MNFITSMGFVATSEIIKQHLGNTGTQTACTTNFSELNKYELPTYTVYVRDSLIESYAETTKLFGFVRGADTFEIRFGVNRMTSTSNGYYRYVLAVTFFKNGVRATSFNANSALTTLKEIQFNSVISKPFTHFYITYATQTALFDNTNCLIYDYNVTSINNYGSNINVVKGAFTIGFCTANFTFLNNYNNCYPNPSTNQVRNVSVVFSVNSNQSSYLTQISEYDTFIEYCLGKSVKYVGDTDISTTGGGFGTFDGSSDTNTIPDTNDTTDFETSNIIMANSGLFTTHIMDNSSLQSFASALWDNSITTLLSHLLVNPLDVVISLKRLPVTLTSSTTKSIHLGITDTEINTPILTQQFVTVNCGAVHPHEFWGNSLDYSPNTKMMIYLPFIGIKNIDVDYYMSKELVVKYIIDVLSGDFVCFLQQTETNIVQNVLATFTGNCAMQYPLSMPNYEQLIGAGATFVSKTVSGGVKGGQIGAVKGALTSVGNTIGSKPEYEKTGGYNANMGFCGIMKPYIIIERPQQSLPDKVEKYCGFPSNIVSKLSTLTGFTKVQDINLSVNCTLDEKNEIENLLKRGVII